MIRFEMNTDVKPLEGELVYRDADHAFDFVPTSTVVVREQSGSKGVTSLLLGTLQLEVSAETGLVLYPWGYHPKAAWLARSLLPAVAPRVAVRAVGDGALDAGVAQDVAPSERWTTSYDAKSGWVRIARSENAAAWTEAVEFAPGSIAVLERGSLVELWLHPRMEDDPNRTRA